MIAPVLLAVLLFVLPKTPPDPTLKGWEAEGTLALPYAAATQHVSADLVAQGWHLVRRETLGEGVQARRLEKYADGRGGLLYVLIWRKDVSRTSYAYRRERSARQPVSFARHEQN